MPQAIKQVLRVSIVIFRMEIIISIDYLHPTPYHVHIKQRKSVRNIANIFKRGYIHKSPKNQARRYVRRNKQLISKLFKNGFFLKVLKVDAELNGKPKRDSRIWNSESFWDLVHDTFEKTIHDKKINITNSLIQLQNRVQPCLKHAEQLIPKQVRNLP